MSYLLHSGRGGWGGGGGGGGGGEGSMVPFGIKPKLAETAPLFDRVTDVPFLEQLVLGIDWVCE